MRNDKLTGRDRELFISQIVKLLRKNGQMTKEEIRMHLKDDDHWKQFTRLVCPDNSKADDLHWIMVILRRDGYLVRIGDINRKKWYRHAITTKGMNQIPVWDDCYETYKYINENKPIVDKSGHANLTDDEEAFLRVCKRIDCKK